MLAFYYLNWSKNSKHNDIDVLRFAIPAEAMWPYHISFRNSRRSLHNVFPCGHFIYFPGRSAETLCPTVCNFAVMRAVVCSYFHPSSWNVKSIEDCSAYCCFSDVLHRFVFMFLKVWHNSWGIWLVYYYDDVCNKFPILCVYLILCSKFENVFDACALFFCNLRYIINWLRCPSQRKCVPPFLPFRGPSPPSSFHVLPSRKLKFSWSFKASRCLGGACEA